jgi:RNA polymerase sigma factor (sigma-70 family)
LAYLLEVELVKLRPLPEGLHRNSLYGYRIEVYDVTNLEALCRQIVNNYSAVKGGRFTRDDHAFHDAIQELVVEALDIAINKYDPKKNNSYRGYVSWLLTYKIADWYSKNYRKRRHIKAADRDDDELRPDISMSAPLNNINPDPDDLYGATSSSEKSADRESALLDVFADNDDWVTAADERVSAQASTSEFSEEMRWTIDNIGLPYADGISQTEIARRIGKTRRFVERALADLRVSLADEEVKVA